MTNQLSLFGDEILTDSSPFHCQEYELPNSEISFFSSFFSPAESKNLFLELKEKVNWKQEKIKYYGKFYDLPRLTAWYGDKGKTYTYSGITVEPDEWIETLLRVKSRIEEVAKVNFNCVLLNYYRDGKDGVSWHSDDEPELGKYPVIGSVSFGETRTFHLKHKVYSNLKEKIELTDGSFLLMKGETQQYWQHQISKTTKTIGPRINLTFRTIESYNARSYP